MILTRCHKKRVKPTTLVQDDVIPVGWWNVLGTEGHPITVSMNGDEYGYRMSLTPEEAESVAKRLLETVARFRRSQSLYVSK